MIFAVVYVSAIMEFEVPRTIGACDAPPME
jgi:hypothetical protein